MGTTIHFKNNIGVGATVTLKDEPVQAAAFYDIFHNNKKLEEFVRELAAGEIQFPAESAQALMDELNSCLVI